MKMLEIIDRKWCMFLAMFLLLVSISIDSFAQKQSITGVVYDSQRQPMFGATVVNIKSNNGFVTDDKGEFEIAAIKGDTLNFSFIGYTPQNIVVGSATRLKVTLEEDALALDAVVAVGYGQMKKRDLTGAITSVSSSVLKESGQTSIESALAGQVAGLVIESGESSPGAASMIRIRGANSINASSEPLYVIDGIPIMNNSNSSTEDVGVSPLAGISVNDIESIDVLKDASATAIYGAQGANGVIIVTTKKGKAQEPKMTFNISGGVQFADIHKYDMMDAQEYAEYRYNQSYQPNIGMGDDAWLDPKWQSKETSDWMDLLTRVGNVQDVHFGLSGGTQRGVTYNLGLGYYRNEAIVVDSDMNRLSLNFSMATDPNKFISFGINTIASHIDRNGTTGGLIGALRYNPTVGVDETDDEEVDAENSNTVNPYQSMVEQDLNNTTSSVNVNSHLTFRLTQDLKLKASLGGNLNNGKISNFYPVTSQSGRNDNGRAYMKDDYNYKLVGDLLLTYNKSFGDHRIDAMVGGTANKYHGYTWIAENRNYAATNVGLDGIEGGTNPSIPVSMTNDWSLLSGFARAFYSYKDKYSVTATFRADGTSRVAYNNRWGFFPSLAFAWRVNEESFLKDVKWISNLKLRAGYGVIGNQNIPSYQAYNTYDIGNTVVGGELVSTLSKSQIANNDLKWETTSSFNLGVDFGVLNSRINASIDIYHKTTNDLLLDAILPSQSGIVNSTMYRNMGSMENKGVELSVNSVNLKGKFFWRTSFNIAFNKNEITDLGDNKIVPVGSAANSQAMLIEGQPIGVWYGLETDGVWQQNQFDYSWGNKYANGVPSGYRRKDEYKNIATIPNEDIPGRWRYKDTDGNGVINGDDREILGVSQPLFTGGLSNSFRYKNFDLNVMFDFSYGKKMFNAIRFSLHESSSSYRNRVKGDSWTPTMFEVDRDVAGVPMGYGDILKEGNPSNSVSAAGRGNDMGYVLSDYIEDASYLRMKSVTLGYTIRSRKIKSIGIEQFRVYVSGTNLFTLTKYSGNDPTINSLSLGGKRLGYDYNAVPMSSTVNIGVQLSF